jgi:hypothetical protein
VSVTTDGPTSQADEAAVAATCIGAQPGMTAGPGYTLTTDLPIATASNKRELGIEVDHLETSGAPTAIFQLGSARNWAASIATYPAEPPPPPTPTVTDVTPGSGQVGDQVTISGTDLTGATVVTFNATAATAFNVDSNTSITATVPTGANTGKVCVTTPGGTGCTVNDFTVTAPVVPSRVGAIGATSNTTGATLNTLSLQVGADGVPVGDTVVMAISAQGVVDITNVADAEGNTYHVDVARPYGGTAACTSAIVSARLSTALSAGDTISVTVSSGKSWGFSADRWTGISGGVDATGSADSGSTTGSAVAVSTTAATSAAHEGVIGVTCIAAQPGFAVGSGYALSRDLLMTYKETRREMGVEYAVVSAVGIQTATLQLDASRNWSAVVATYA